MLMALKFSKWLLYSLTLTPLLVWKGLYYQFSTTEAFFVMAVVEILVLSFIWAVHEDPQLQPRLGLVGKAFLLFVAVSMLASIFGVDPILSFWSTFDRLTGIVFWFHLLALMVVAGAILRTPQDWRWLFTCSISVGLLVSIFHLLAFTGLDGTWLIHRSGTIGNSTFFGVYLLFQMVLGALLFVRGSRPVQIYAAGLGMVFIIALWTSEAQAVLVSFVGGLILALALAAIVKGVHRPVLRGAGMFTIVLLVVLFFAGLVGLANPSSTIREAFVEYSSGSRFALWDMAWEGIKDRPLLGWGSENFPTVFSEHYNPCFGSSTCGAQSFYDRAHNKVLDVFVETGIVGIVAYLAIFAVAAWTLWCRPRADRNMTGIILTAGFASYFVQNLGALDVPVTLVFWVLLLVFAEHVGHGHEKDRKNSRPIPSSVVVGATLCLPILFFFCVVQPLQANASIAQWFLAESADERLAALDRATDLSFVGLDDRRAYMARQAAGAVWISSIRGETQRPASQIELAMIRDRLEDSRTRNPGALSLALNLALVIQTQTTFLGMQDYETPIALLEQAIQDHPRNPQPYWALSSSYLQRGRAEEALAATQIALDLDPEVTESILQRLIAAKFVQDQELLVEYTKEALLRFPSLEPEIRFIYEADPIQKRYQLLFELY